MKIRLLLDEDVHLSLGQALSKRGYDAVHVQEIQRSYQYSNISIILVWRSMIAVHCERLSLLLIVMASGHSALVDRDQGLAKVDYE